MLFAKSSSNKIRVNLELVTGFKESEYHGGKIHRFYIIFFLADETSDSTISWSYDTKEDRDEDIKAIDKRLTE